MSFFKKLLNRKQPKPIEKPTINNWVAEPSYNFVDQYVVIDPKKLLINEESFALCNKIPVAYDYSPNNTGWHACAQLDTRIMLPFLRTLRQMPAEQISSVAMRTVSVINLDKDKRIYVLPDFREQKSASIGVVFDKGDERAWPLYMTPEKRHAIVEQLKIHTR